MSNNDDVKKIEQELLRSDWKDEAKQIPLEEMDLEEVIVVKKCIDEEDMTDDEIVLLKKVLQSYRNVIENYKLKNVEENIKKHKEMVKTEQYMLNLLDEFNNQIFVLNLPLRNETLELEFDIKPITNSKEIKDLQEHVGLFSDFTEKEKELIQKSQSNQKLSKREQKIVEGLNKRFNDLLDENDDEIIINVLANQLIMLNNGNENNSDLETRKAFWRKLPANIRTGAYLELQDVLGLGNVQNNKLFNFR